MSSVTVSGPGLIQGTFIPPGDKSISHRAVMFGALSDGESSYTHFLEAEDCLSTLEAFRAMGVSIDHKKGSGKITIHGVGLRGLKAPEREIYLGNSGTSMRVLMGILAGQKFEVTLTGDPSLTSRPMRRVTDPLKKMGAQIKGKDNGNFAPITIRGGKLKGIDFDNHLASAQVKSALLFAGLYAEGQTKIRETISSRDHTERFLQSAGASFKRAGQWLVVEKTEHLKPFHAEIPGDISAAAFFITAAAMTRGSSLTVEKVCLNPTRTGLIRVLERMGASIQTTVTQTDPEPLGIIQVQGRKLKGTRISKDEIPSLIDELPILMTAMAVAEGESLISGAEELRVKETDRIHSMAVNLNRLGAQLEELPDGCIIRGGAKLYGGKVTSFGDHRTAMSMAIAALTLEAGEVVIEDTDCVATSFPSFFDELNRLRK
ncbi:MAG: 3-phosphoshikimate 1-carboxyvinyltransferase [Candidatus Omnitrophica bacterium]|nr:3-phosphoshikimate 1-carboxyvinyltransferase [Candidatus Omnitrophota bacterium]